MKVGKPKFSINSRGLMAWAREAVAVPNRDNAEKVAARVREKLPADVRVDVWDDINDDGRPVSVITIAHASGLAREAKDRLLTRSAAELGFDVTPYGGVS